MIIPPNTDWRTGSVRQQQALRGLDRLPWAPRPSFTLNGVLATILCLATLFGLLAIGGR